MERTKTGTGGRKRVTYPACSTDGYDATPNGDGLTYTLTIKPGVPTVTYYTSDDKACAWSLSVYSAREDLSEDEVASGNWSPDHLHLTIGDMGYHSVPKDLIQAALSRADQDDYLRSVAADFDETGEDTDDIYELFQTYLELIDLNDVLVS